MPVGPIAVPLVVVPTLEPEADEELEEAPEPVTTCGRCRLSFVRHPSISPVDSPKWWLCPACRARLLGDASKTNARWR